MKYAIQVVRNLKSGRSFQKIAVPRWLFERTGYVSRSTTCHMGDCHVSRCIVLCVIAVAESASQRPITRYNRLHRARDYDAETLDALGGCSWGRWRMSHDVVIGPPPWPPGLHCQQQQQLRQAIAW